MYKVGDKARVKEDLVVGSEYGSYFFIEEMNKYKGKEVTIKTVKENYSEPPTYLIEEETHSFIIWTSDMLEPIEETKEKMNLIEALTWLKDQPEGTRVVEAIVGDETRGRIVKKDNDNIEFYFGAGYLTMLNFNISYTKPKQLINFNEFMQKTFEKFIIVKSEIGKYYGTRCDNTKCSECFFKDLDNCDVGDLENITKEEFEGKFEIVFEKEIEK